MSSTHRVRRDRPQRAYLVERYISTASADELAGSTARTAALCADRDHISTGVQYLYSAYLPSEDTCFCLFRAASSDAVRALNDHAEFALDRITDAELLIFNSADMPLLPRASTP
jgi:hypothetical protein